MLIAYNAEIEINILQRGGVTNIATWTKSGNVQPLPDQEIVAAKRYFRIGTAPVCNRNFIVFYSLTVRIEVEN